MTRAHGAERAPSARRWTSALNHADDSPIRSHGWWRRRRIEESSMSTEAELSVAGLELRGRLGLGAHTAVYRAHRQGRDYAVKVLRDGSGGAAVLRAFRREAALLASVRHPGLPAVYEVGLAGTQPYLVMELLEGRSLRTALQAGPLDPVAVAALGSC